MNLMKLGGMICVALMIATPALALDWVRNPSSGHYYSVVEGDWYECENQAVMLGGHLVSIGNAEENAWLKSEIISAVPTPQNAWIGLCQSGGPEPAGGWGWVSGEPLTYTCWEPYEPNDGQTGDEDWAHMYWNGNWNDTLLNCVRYGIVETAQIVPEPPGGLVLLCSLCGSALWKRKARQLTTASIHIG